MMTLDWNLSYLEWLSNFFVNSNPISVDQQWILDRLEKSGYKLYDTGICFGIALMGMQAILAQDTKRFFQRIGKIHATPIDSFADETKRFFFIKEEIFAFFDGVIIYQNASMFPQLFKKEPASCSANALLMYPRANPHGLANVVTPIRFSGIYNHIELTIFFAEIHRIMQQEKISFPVAFVLNNGDHTITVGYFPHERNAPWQLIDANQLGTNQLMNSHLIAETVCFAHSDDKNVLMAVEVFVERFYEKAITHCFSLLSTQERWKKIQTISNEKLKFVSSNGYTWLLIAARFNPQMLEILLNTAEDKTDKINLLAQCGPNGWNSLMTSLHCHHEYAKPLLKIISTFDQENKAYVLKQCSTGGWNALLIAVFSNTNQLNPLWKQIISLKDEKIRKEILGQSISDGWGLKEAIKEHRVSKEFVELIKKIDLDILLQEKKPNQNALFSQPEKDIKDQDTPSESASRPGSL